MKTACRSVENWSTFGRFPEGTVPRPGLAQIWASRSIPDLGCHVAAHVDMLACAVRSQFISVCVLSGVGAGRSLPLLSLVQISPASLLQKFIRTLFIFGLIWTLKYFGLVRIRLVQLQLGRLNPTQLDSRITGLIHQRSSS